MHGRFAGKCKGAARGGIERHHADAFLAGEFCRCRNLQRQGIRLDEMKQQRFPVIGHGNGKFPIGSGTGVYGYGFIILGEAELLVDVGSGVVRGNTFGRLLGRAGDCQFLDANQCSAVCGLLKNPLGMAHHGIVDRAAGNQHQRHCRNANGGGKVTPPAIQK